jgi:predicted DNA binding CopG/RHH family protein
MTEKDLQALSERDWGDEWEGLPLEELTVAPPPDAAQVTLRISNAAVAELKRVAEKTTLPYHALARSWILEAVANSREPTAEVESFDAETAADSQLNLKLGADKLQAIKAVGDQLRLPYHRLIRLWLYEALFFAPVNSQVPGGKGAPRSTAAGGVLPGVPARIAQALQEKELDHKVFERCADTLLLPIYPGLTPIPGGTDFGRDADIPAGAEIIRLLATTAKNVEENLRGGLLRLEQTGLSHRQVIIATSQVVSATRRRKLDVIAAEQGAVLVNVHERSWLAGQLYWHPDWRKDLLGISGEMSALVERPLDLFGSDADRLKLVGRDAEQRELTEALGHDLVVTGVPGVGKTRILAELPGAVFVQQATPERLADDLRHDRPEVVVVDDASDRVEEIRLLQRVRQEAALEFSIVVVVWPDQVDAARRDLRSVERVVTIGLLEMGDMVEVLDELGVTSYLLKREILEQAGGRPGWAIALAEMALAGNVDSVLSGSALEEESVRYLSGLGETFEAQGVLAHMAALSGVADDDLDGLATSTGMDRAKVGSMLGTAARRGLVTPRYGRWTVGPDALRRGLVAKWFFASPTKASWDTLVQGWPERKQDLLAIAVDVAAAGSAPARRRVDQEFKTLLTSADGWAVVRPLLDDYALIDEAAADIAVTHLLKHLKPAVSGEPGYPPDLQEVLHLAAARYLSPNAIRGLLNLAEGDERPLNSTPDHPLRQLQELATRIMPDIGVRFDDRIAVASTAHEWIDDKPNPSRWRVWSRLLADVVSPDLGGNWPELGNARTVTVSGGVLSCQLMQEVVERIWPPVLSRLDTSPDEAVALVLDTLLEWARVAAGHPGPFGATVTDEMATCAREAGEKMLTGLVPRCQRSAGLSLRFNHVAGALGTALALLVDPELALLAEPLTREWRDVQERKGGAIKDLVRTWAAEEPGTVIHRLSEHKRALSLAPNPAFDWMGMALYELAEIVDDPASWAEAVANAGFYPEGFHLMRAAARRA